MEINEICMSIFTKENYMEYNSETVIQLLELFKEKNVIPSYVKEIYKDMQSIDRPLIISNLDNILLIMGLERIDIRNNINEYQNNKEQYQKNYLIEFLKKFEYYSTKLISNYKDLVVNRIAINLSILCDRKLIDLSSRINLINFYESNNIDVISNLRQQKVVSLNNEDKLMSNVILNFISNNKINIKFDINTLYNTENNFSNEEIKTFFIKSIDLIDNMIGELNG